jgi:hypothetical protein
MGTLLLDSTPSDSDPRLTELVIPGTHHSGSYSIHSWLPFGRNIGSTQGSSVYEQLCSGARYLDLRVAPTRDDGGGGGQPPESVSFSIWHNFLRGAPIEIILRQIRDFCQDHTDEIIIVELVPEFGRTFTEEQKERCLVCCLSELDGLLLPCYSSSNGQEEAGSASSFLTKCPTILQKSVRQILSEGPERVLLVLHHRFDAVLTARREMLKPFVGRFLPGSRCLHNPWHNTNQRQVLQECNLRCVLQEECDRCNNNDGDVRRQRLLCSQLAATPQASSAMQILTLIGTGTRSLWPRTLARILYQQSASDSTTRGKGIDNNDNYDDASLLEWFRRTTAAVSGSVEKSATKKEGAKWNICSLDFIELCPPLVEAMILANAHHGTASSSS